MQRPEACQTDAVREPVVRVSRVADVRIGSGFLTAAEAGRWQRLVQDADRRAYLAAHVLVRQAAAELLGLPAGDADRLELEQSCPTCGAVDHGRPRIGGRPELHVSLSHVRGVVAAIAAERPCGIDVETYAAGDVPAEMLTARERRWAAAEPEAGAAAIRLWTRKEAWVKASGESLERAAELDALDAAWLTGELQSDQYAAAWVVL